MIATVVSLTADPYVGTLTAAAAVGDVVLQLDDVGDFPASGTLLWPDGTLVDYTAADRDNDTLTLAAPVLTAAAAGDTLISWDTQAGAPFVEYVAQVVTAGDAGDPLEATVDHALIDKFGTNPAVYLGAPVTVEETDLGDLEVTQVHGRDAVVDASRSVTPSIQLGTDIDQALFDSTWTDVLWGGYAVPSRFPVSEWYQLDTDTGVLTVLQAGYYRIEAGCRFDGAVGGARELRTYHHRSDGGADYGSWSDRRLASDSGEMTCAVVFTVSIGAGEQIRVQVRQNSGTELTLLTGYAGTYCTLTWAGPR